MSSEIAIRGLHLGKYYEIFSSPGDRLKQIFFGNRKKYFHEFWALKDISFEVRKGESVGIVGSNGSGKTTLLKIICGVLNESEGTIQVKGRAQGLLELGAGFNPDFTGNENIFMLCAVFGLTHGETRSLINDILDFSGIGDFADQPVKTFSSGMIVRLGFALYAHIPKDILIIDEALAVGDLRFRERCMDYIKNFRSQGTILFTSHEPGLITELCDRTIWLDQGRLKASGETKGVTEKYLEFMLKGENAVQTAAKPQLPEGASNCNYDLNDFSPIQKNCRQFGNGKASILSVCFRTASGSNFLIYAGESFELSLLVHANEKIDRPIAGYLFRDSLGREIIGDNSALITERLEPFEKGRTYLATFIMEHWPNIASGGYALSVAVSEGSIHDFQVNHWVHDALVVEGVHSRLPCGLFSVLKTEVNITEVESHASELT